MTDLRTALHDIADDAPDLDAVRRRLHRPRRRLAPVLAAAGVVVVAVATAAVLSSREPAPPVASAPSVDRKPSAPARRR